MKRVNAKRERGAALLALLAVIMLGASWFLVSQLNAESGSAAAARKTRNAEVLNRAKQALIGYVAAQATKSFEDNPGALPCPEHAWYISLPDKEGTTGPSIGVANPGYGTANCSSIGRFPWRTIGTDKLTDASGQPLWIVVGPAWRKTSTSTKTTINSNTAGDVTVDGQQVVALIIAPGQAMVTQTGTTPYGVACSARNQARSAPVGTMDPLDYIECYNAATLQFSTTGPGASFNDQVAKVTAADLIPGIEAAVANRIEREIVPLLKSAYTGTKWNASAGQTVLPFAAPFTDPGTSPFQGSASPATTAGLLPFSYSPTCSPAGDARCTSSSFHSWSTPSVSKTSGSGSLWIGPNCSVSGAYVTCTGYYQVDSLTANFDDQLGNMATALRDFTLTNHTARVWTILYNGSSWDGWVEVSSSTVLSRRFNSNGALSFMVGNIPLRWAGGTAYGYYYIEAQRPTVSDHVLLSSSDTITGWFVRNEWYRLLYYAIAPDHAPGGSLSCTTGGTCLSVANGDPTRPITPTNGQRAILIFAGSGVAGQASPRVARSDYFEYGNATGTGTLAFPFERQPLRRSAVVNVTLKLPFNDRVIVIDSN